MSRFSAHVSRWFISAAIALAGAVAVPAAQAAFIPVPQQPSLRISVNDVVRAIVIGDGVAYVAGDFTSATGPNGTFPRSRVAAFDLATGAVTPFRADTNDRVRALAVAGNSVFVGGDFATVNGVARARLAEVDAATGAVRTAFRVNTSSAVRALAVGGNQLIVGGQFGTIGNVQQRRLAAVNLTTRTLNASFRPALDNTVHAVAVSPDGQRVYAGGDFVTVDGASRRYLAQFTAAGVLTPTVFAFPTDNPYNVLGLDLNDDGSRIYAAVGGQGNQATAFNTVTGGNRLWRQRAEGDVQAVTYNQGNVFFGFHEGFEGNFDLRLLAADAGSGALESAFRPPVNSYWGVRALDATDGGVAVGGEFTRINGVDVGRATYFDANLGPVPPTVTSLVGSNASWQYHDGPALAAGWNQPAFDTSGWKSGPAQLGYGDGDENTVIGYGPDANNKHRTAYFRRIFTWDGSYTPTWLTAELVADDGAIVTINGQEVIRDNMPAGAVTANTYAVSNRSGAAENAARSFPLDPGLLQVGTNVITVEVHQDYRNSSDLSMQMALATGR